MGYIEPRQQGREPNKKTVYYFKWRLGTGGRESKKDFEKFDSLAEAERFKDDFEKYGGYPPNYLPKIGYVTAEQLELYRLQVEAAARPALPTVTFAEHSKTYIDKRQGIDERTRADYHRDLRRHMLPRFGSVDMRAASQLTRDDVADWVKWLSDGERDPACADDWLRSPLSRKTVSNLHGLLYAICGAAVEATYRESNPCVGTVLPSRQHAVYAEDADEEDEGDVQVLDDNELALLYSLTPEPIKPLVLAGVGTGARYGELTALKRRDIKLEAATPHIRIVRAWKRGPNYTYHLGPPKSEAGVRNIPLSPFEVEMYGEMIEGKGPQDWVLTGPKGGPWRHANFYSTYWQPLIYQAARCERHRLEDYEAGCRWRSKLTAEWIKPCGCPGTLLKTPRFHVLRHTCVSILLAKNVPLNAIQVRVGHAHYSTTERVYGHLLPELDRRQAQAMDAALIGMTGTAPRRALSLLRAA